MKTNYRINLSPALAGFVEEAVASGEYASADALVEAALTKLRTECTLSGPSRASAPTEPDLALPPVVDTKRQSFDGPKFMAEMMDKLWAKK